MRCPSPSRPRRGAALALVLAVSACAISDGTDPLATGLGGSEGPLFLVQSEPATAVMDALFEGSIREDDAGCLRTQATGAIGATVVWPYGFTLRTLGDDPYVMNADGRVVGRIGGVFLLGGGYVPSLHEGIPLADAARAAATERCPGSYWIVGDVP